jgi:hypothetical protein
MAGANLPGHNLLNQSTQMQLIEPNQPRSQSNSDLGFLLALAVVGGIGATLYAGRNAGRNTGYNTGRNTGRNHSHARSHAIEANPKHYHPDQAASLNQLNGTLQHKLLRQLQGDRAAANRLLAHTKLKYPDRSASWCAEKVIYDLERDRSRA